MQRISSSHSFGESALHLQFTPKYRRAVFTDPTILKATKGVLHWVSRELGIELVAAEGGPDHIHLFITNWKNYAIPALAHRFKGRVAYELRKRFPDLLWRFRLGRSFWTDGYYYETVGSVTAEARQYYVQRCQHKHWLPLQPVVPKGQKTLTSFTNH